MNIARSLAIICLASLAIHSTSALAAPSSDYTEPFRPQYHFTPPKNWMNDPNGLVFYEGEYHLFYQYNPFGDKWGHTSWGHAVSRDLVHWQHLPVALAEENGVMIFSGSAVIDWQNTSGFGTNGKPPMIAIYTGFRPSDGMQFQCIAYSTDKGRSWTKFSDNPVIDIRSKDFRDPKVQWHRPTQQWVMTVSLAAERKVRFYGSKNLKQWKLLSDFGPAGATDGAWECPDLFELPVDGTKEKRWVLTVNTSSGNPAGGSGGQYFLGQFDGTNFVADAKTQLWFDYGRDCYATVSWSDAPKSDSRRLWIGWMTSIQYAQDVPTSPWRSAMTIPREVGLRKTSDGIRLVQKPASELAKLREKHFTFKGGDVTAANAWLKKKQIAGDCLEIVVEFDCAKCPSQGLKICKGATDETIIGVDRASSRVFVDRTKSGKVDFNPQFAGIHYAALLSHTGKVTLHVFVDACSAEAFINDGESVITDLIFPSQHSRGVEFFSSTSNSKILSAEIWTLRSAWK